MKRVYTVGSTFVDLPVSETFAICRSVCEKIKQTNVQESDEERFIMKGKSKPSIHSFVGWPFVLVITKKDNGSAVQVYYNYTSPGNRSMRADLINPFFKELDKTTKTNETKTDVQTIPDSFFTDVNAPRSEPNAINPEKNGIEIKFAEDGLIKKVVIDSTSTKLDNGEELLWSYDFTQGILRKK